MTASRRGSSRSCSASHPPSGTRPWRSPSIGRLAGSSMSSSTPRRSRRSSRRRCSPGSIASSSDSDGRRRRRRPCHRRICGVSFAGDEIDKSAARAAIDVGESRAGASLRDHDADRLSREGRRHPRLADERHAVAWRRDPLGRRKRRPSAHPRRAAKGRPGRAVRRGAVADYVGDEGGPLGWIRRRSAVTRHVR